MPLSWPQLHEQHAREPLKCAHCGKPAVCVGVYEDPDGLAQPACDLCCAHGGEDGYCEFLEDDHAD